MKALILRSGVEPKSLHLKQVFLLSVLALHLEKYNPNFLPLSLSAPFLSPTQSHSIKVFVLFFAIVILLFFFLLFILIYIQKIFVFCYLFLAIVITENYRYS